jgi:hypothetical protein
LDPTNVGGVTDITYHRPELYEVSFYPDRSSTAPQDITLGEFAERCRTDFSMDACRGQDKAKLPAITPGGRFRGGRRAEHLVQRSGLVFVDIDAKAQRRPIEWHHVDALRRDPHTVLVKRSYSGGLHVFLLAEDAPFARQHVERLTGLVADEAAGTKPNSLCSFSYDPTLYLADQALVLRGRVAPPVARIAAPLGKPAPGDLGRCERILERQGRAFVDGQRNDYLYRLALLMRDRGHTEQDTVATIADKYPDHRLEDTVRSAFAHAQGPTVATVPEVEARVISVERWASEAADEVAETVRANPRHVVVVVGDPNIGKTTMCQQVADKLDAELVGIFPNVAQVKQRGGWTQLYGGSSGSPTDRVVATTWDRSGEVPMEGRLAVLDEAHELLNQASPGFRDAVANNTLERFRAAPFQLALSATPERCVAALELMGIPCIVLHIKAREREQAPFTFSVYELDEAQLPAFVKGADLVFRDHKEKNAQLCEALEATGDRVGVVDTDTGDEIMAHIAAHEALPEVDTLLTTRRLMAGVNIRKSVERMVVIDPTYLEDVVQIAHRERVRGVHVDVVFTRAPKTRKTYAFDELIRHLAEIQRPGSLLFDLAELEALEAVQDGAVKISAHLRRGGIIACAYHAIPTGMSAPSLRDYLTRHGWKERAEVEVPKCDIDPVVVEDQRQAHVQRIREDLAGAMGKRRAAKVLKHPERYSPVAVEAAQRAGDEDPVPASGEKLFSALLAAGGLLDTFGLETACDVLERTKRPGHVLARYRRRQAVSLGGDMVAQSLRRLREDLATGEWTKAAIETVVEKHMARHVRQLKGAVVWWELAHTLANITLNEDRRTYTVHGVLDLDHIAVGGSCLRLKPASALKKPATRTITTSIADNTHAPGWGAVAMLERS